MPLKLYADDLETIVGPITAAVDMDGSVVVCGKSESRRAFEESADRVGNEVGWSQSACRDVIGQLAEYFRGERRRFELAVNLRGTKFQKEVWAALQRIPFGATATYGEISSRIGSPRAVRAVGRANGANPVAIIVPCHRVIGADGSLTGYGGGMEMKRMLLELEGRQSPLPMRWEGGSGVR